jgi:hypothetical protein
MEYRLSLVKPMYEAFLRILSFIGMLVAASGNMIIRVERLDIFYLFLIALTLAFLTARIASKKDGSFSPKAILRR